MSNLSLGASLWQSMPFDTTSHNSSRSFAPGRRQDAPTIAMASSWNGGVVGIFESQRGGGWILDTSNRCLLNGARGTQSLRPKVTTKWARRPEAFMSLATEVKTWCH